MNGTALNPRLITTGVNGLDNVLDGGFPKGSLVVLVGNPGTGKTVFSACFLYIGAANHGEKGIYASFAENKEAFIENMRSFGWDFERLERERLFRFLDMLTVKEQAVSSVLNMIISKVERLGAERLVLDSFSAMAQAFKEPIDARIIVHTVLSKLIRGMGCTTLLIKETYGDYSKNIFGAEEFVADGVIRLSTEELEGLRLRSLEILKLRGVRLKEPGLVFTPDRGV
ncbi:MAG: ATPase domain-containing protein [Candidatus Bathyarchaeia archaeon]